MRTCGTNEIREISWEVLWLVAGGISLKDSGLAVWMISLVNLTSLGDAGVIV